MGLGAGDPRVSHPPTTHQAAAFRGHIVRLNSIEPNTVMFSTKDYPLLSDVSVPEIIDELEQQFDSKLCEVQGVRLAGSKIFICLSQRDCLTHLAQYGFYVRGVHVSVLDISNDSVVVCLIGVPHYITDSTITMLVGTFGICIGEVERRFYKVGVLHVSFIAPLTTSVHVLKSIAAHIESKEPEGCDKKSKEPFLHSLQSSRKLEGGWMITEWNKYSVKVRQLSL